VGEESWDADVGQQSPRPMKDKILNDHPSSSVKAVHTNNG
jgi:hypothetical protein